MNNNSRLFHCANLVDFATFSLWVACIQTYKKKTLSSSECLNKSFCFIRCAQCACLFRCFRVCFVTKFCFVLFIVHLLCGWFAFMCILVWWSIYLSACVCVCVCFKWMLLVFSKHALWNTYSMCSVCLSSGSMMSFGTCLWLWPTLNSSLPLIQPTDRNSFTRFS